MTNKERTQRVVADILTQFMFAKNMDEVIAVWDRIFADYELCRDPFTGCPCSPCEYADNNMEYQRQLMIEKYGHCDGLE